jgi:molybdopterin-guanine dinucleotide biosynthesis protein A
MLKATKPAGVILAGGRSSRMGVTHKAMLDLKARPLLAHVIERLQPQTDLLMLSCESKTDAFDVFGLPVVADLLPRHRGPLTGLHSALQYLSDKRVNGGLVLCPCDAPFIPVNLVQTLLDAYQRDTESVVVVAYQGVLQPTFSMWQNHHLPAIDDAVINRGRGGLKDMLRSLPHTIVEWPPAEPPPFFNVNTPEELKTAGTWLDRQPA